MPGRELSVKKKKTPKYRVSYRPWGCYKRGNILKSSTNIVQILVKWLKIVCNVASKEYYNLGITGKKLKWTFAVIKSFSII